MPTLFINVDATDISQSSVRGLNTLTPIGIPQLVLGDNRDWSIYFVTAAGQYTSWSGNAGYALRIGIGPSGKNATSGTFTISGDGAILSGTTNPIAFDADAAAVLAALTDSSGGLTVISTSTRLTTAQINVTGNASDYVLNFIGTLAGTAIGALALNSGELSPPSSGITSIVRAGGSGINARQSMRVRQLPYCFQDTWTTVTSGWTGTISTNTDALAQYLENATGEDLPFEIEVTDGSGNHRTYFQGTTAILNEVIDAQALVPTPLPDYYTSAETDTLLASTLADAEAYTDAAIAALPPETVTSLTTTGSGAATLVGGTLNIPTPTPANIGAATSAQGALADSALQPDGDGSALTGITASQVGALTESAADALYQPLENQRLSTSDSPTFQTVSLGLLKTNEIQNASGGTQLAVYDGLDGIWDVSGRFTGDLTGNADTATKLATPRAINGVDFDGSAPITVPAAGSTLTDTVTVAKGGTGATTLSANAVLLGNGTSAVQSVAPSTSGNVLTSNGTTWQSTAPAAGVSGANPTGTIGLTAVNGSATTYLRSDGAPALSQAIAPTWTGIHTFAPTARTSGSAPFLLIASPADTTLAASTEAIGMSKTASTRQFATGALTLQREVVLAAPTISAVGASTVTTAVNLDVAEPIAGTNATLTNKFAVRAASLKVTGTSQLDGVVTIAKGTNGGTLNLGDNSAIIGGINYIQTPALFPQNDNASDIGTASFRFKNVLISGDFKCDVAGKGLQLKSGTGARAGTATMVAGTITITNSTVTASTKILYSRAIMGGVVGNISRTVSAGTSFTLNSDNALETSSFDWFLVELN